MTSINEALRKLPDDVMLGPLEKVDDVLSDLIETFNDMVDSKRSTCSITPQKVSPESTGADLKREISKLPIEDQMELLSNYAKGSKELTPEEEQTKFESKKKWSLIEKMANFVIYTFGFLIGAFVLSGLVTGHFDKDLIFKVIDTIADLVKYFVGNKT